MTRPQPVSGLACRLPRLPSVQELLSLRLITSKIAWMGRTLSPWCAGALLLLSFTADAGQEAAQGASRAGLSARAALTPEELIPALRALHDARGGIGELAVNIEAPPASYFEARLVTGAPEDLAARPDEIAPRSDLKPRAGAAPALNIAAKGDPFVALRPSFDTRLRGPGGLAGARAASLVFGVDDSLPVSAFELDANGAFSVSDADILETAETRARTGHARSKAPDFHDGATPALPRAVTLASTTPTTPDLAPVTVSLVILNAPKNVTVAERAPDQPDFAALIAPGSAKDEEKCLAQAIYFEARSEPEEGMAAVAQVVLNRVKTGLYADSVCGVVFQNSRRYKACQFSFTCEGKSLRVTELEHWQTALRIAGEVTEGKTWLADVGSSTHYHATYVRPDWASRLKRMDQIGHHIFYRQRDG